MERPQWAKELTDDEVERVVALMTLASSLVVNTNNIDNTMTLTFHVPDHRIVTADAALWRILDLIEG